MINHDAVTAPDPAPSATEVLDKQEKRLRSNGGAPGNTWRDTLDSNMWAYHDKYNHIPLFADCVECTHVIVYLCRDRRPDRST